MIRTLSPARPAANEPPSFFAVPLVAKYQQLHRGSCDPHFVVELATPGGTLTLAVRPRVLQSRRLFERSLLACFGWSLQPLQRGVEWGRVVAAMLARGRDAVT